MQNFDPGIPVFEICPEWMDFEHLARARCSKSMNSGQISNTGIPGSFFAFLKNLGILRIAAIFLRGRSGISQKLGI
mgnify:CR=1 FL=1